MIRKLSIRQKIFYWNICIIIIFAINGIFFANKSVNKMMEDKKSQIKNLTDAAAGIIYKYMELEKSGKLNHEQAVAGIKTALLASRYDGDNYFFIADINLKQILNPKRPKEDGVFQTLPQFQKFKEILIKNKGGDYVTYMTTKPGSTGNYPKLTYLLPIPEWQWFIGTRLYIDDIDKQKNENLLIEGIITLFLTIFLVFGGIKISNFITIPLSKITSSLKNSSQHMEEKSKELTNMSDDVIKSSNEQAKSIQVTAAGITEVTSMILRTAALTTNSENLSKTIGTQIEKGNQSVNEMVSAMESIDEASKQLSKIEEIIMQIETKTLVINDIVSKTELLSLNASIESARAGEYGKGFAVVAEEVGSLANTSGKSSNEIRELLEQSRVSVKNILELTVNRVSEGQNKTKEVSNTFSKIIQDVNEIQSQMQQIAEATKEQEIGVSQISEAMTKIDQSAIKNLSNADLSKIASSNILEISHEIKKITTKTEAIVFGEK